MVGLGQFENVKSGSDEVALTPFSNLTGPTRGMRRDKRRPDPAKAELPSLPRKPLIFIDNAHIAPCRLFLDKRMLICTKKLIQKFHCELKKQAVGVVSCKIHKKKASEPRKKRNSVGKSIYQPALKSLQ